METDWERITTCATCHCQVQEHGCTAGRCGLFGQPRDVRHERGPGKFCPTCHCLYEERGCTNLLCRVHPGRTLLPNGETVMALILRTQMPLPDAPRNTEG